MGGIARELAGAEPRRARPLTRPMLRRLVTAMGDAPLDRRDRAAILVAWQGALRRSELAALQWRDWSAPAPPLAPFAAVTLRRSKARDGPVTVRLPEDNDPALCAIRALGAWREAAPLTLPGAAIFAAADRFGTWTGAPLTVYGFHNLLARRLQAARLATEGFSPHSLRAGWITEAAATGATVWAIKEHSRHTTSAMVELYVRDMTAATGHPTSRMR